MNRFLWMIYVQPLNRIIWFMVLLIALWSIVGYRSDKKKWWKLFNAAIFFCSFSAIAFMTVYSREAGVYEVILTPFQSFIEAKENREMYRSMMMNVFLFVPIGLSMPYVLPQRCNKRMNGICTILFGMCLSATIEWCQYKYGLGRCEVDDIIMNTIGASIGTISYLIYGFLYKYMKLITEKVFSCFNQRIKKRR